MSGERYDLCFDEYDCDDEPLVFKRAKLDGKIEKSREFVEEDFGDGEEEEEEGEFYSVENDTEMVSASSYKRIKHIQIDRLSALPDSLLIRILSYLKTKEAATTAVLSKRWQFLWTDLPKLVLWDSSSRTEKIREFVAWVHRTLAMRSRNELERFEVDFTYDKCFATDVNVWIAYAAKNKVKEVALLLNSCKDWYRLPQMMYSNSSLAWLRLRGCTIDPRRTIEWRSLTTLYLEEVELCQNVMEKIFSGCPVLNILSLTACWGLNCLEVYSRSLFALLIEDWKDRDSGYLLEISAPYIHCLGIWLHPKVCQLQLTNIQSVEEVHVNFNGFDWEASSEEVMSYTEELFENLQHVKIFELGPRCIEVLSVLVMDGWQLSQSKRVCLTVDASRDKQGIPGILGLLDSSPNLETLVIRGCDPYEAGVTWDLVAGCDLNCDLLHLKTVNITNFMNPKFGSEPMLTLARVLLKKAMVLEKMVIDIEEVVASSSTLASGEPFKIAQTLLSYPRFSQKAVILLR